MVGALVVSMWLVAIAVELWLSARSLAEQGASLGAGAAAVEALHDTGRNALVSVLLSVVVIVGATLLVLRLERARALEHRRATEDAELALLGRMSGVMAHELRNPLASAKGHAQLLAELLDEGSRAERKAAYVVQELARLEALTDRLVTLARSGRIQRRREDPRALARLAASRFETGEASTTPVELDLERAPSSWSLDAYATEQVLANLLRNAAQAQADPTNPVQLTVELQDDELHCEVRDHGPGFPPDLDPFALFVSTRSTGMGLGLAVSRQIVLAHGGRIEARNHPDGGAVVELRIPDQRPPSTDHRAPAAGAEEREP